MTSRFKDRIIGILIGTLALVFCIMAEAKAAALFLSDHYLMVVIKVNDTTEGGEDEVYITYQDPSTTGKWIRAPYNKDGYQKMNELDPKKGVWRSMHYLKFASARTVIQLNVMEKDDGPNDDDKIQTIYVNPTHTKLTTIKSKREGWDYDIQFQVFPAKQIGLRNASGPVAWNFSKPKVATQPSEEQQNNEWCRKNPGKCIKTGTRRPGTFCVRNNAGFHVWVDWYQASQIMVDWSEPWEGPKIKIRKSVLAPGPKCGYHPTKKDPKTGKPLKLCKYIERKPTRVDVWSKNPWANSMAVYNEKYRQVKINQRPPYTNESCRD